ncbi:hypothetical protein DAPPUDRAFT_264015 [Daphnia pulex]|uniref:PiggyBac transposable element-derived protein domain-containing protein n=1 Tax=Daphnia pulex TaxID=6669 RepID=E9HQS2_DAPPU|nr:hypothetical protein DAPPUDRAFT_264015 [Daphnia pulex]|eukprot:EFX65913.1 hypothetical protein DAPPUDRAFT_264015 [Daphnia pulex]
METCMVNSWITYRDLVTIKDKKGKTFLKDKRYLSLLEFKRSVATSLLFYGLNADKARKEDAPEARLMKEIPLSAEPGAKRRKDRLSVPDEIRFGQVGIHHPFFVENRGRCEWCQATTERRPNGHTKESRPFSQCSMCKIFLCLSKKRNCFLEFHDDRILDPTKAAAETVLAVDPDEEIEVQTVETDPLGIYPSSDSSDDSDFDVLNNDHGQNNFGVEKGLTYPPLQMNSVSIPLHRFSVL